MVRRQKRDLRKLVLQQLYFAPREVTELVTRLKSYKGAVYYSLKTLKRDNRVRKTQDGLYEITFEGRTYLESGGTVKKRYYVRRFDDELNNLIKKTEEIQENIQNKRLDIAGKMQKDGDNKLREELSLNYEILEGLTQVILEHMRLLRDSL